MAAVLATGAAFAWHNPEHYQPGVIVMQLTSRQHPGATVLVAAERIDQASAGEFLAALQTRLKQHDPATAPVVIDFAGVDYISSVGLRALMVIAREIKAGNGKIGIAALQPLVREVFGIARFDLVIPCFDSVDDAIAQLST